MQGYYSNADIQRNINKLNTSGLLSRTLIPFHCEPAVALRDRKDLYFKKGDKLEVMLNPAGEVQILKNGCIHAAVKGTCPNPGGPGWQQLKNHWSCEEGIDFRFI